MGKIYGNKRMPLLDVIRGCTIISMIGYHAAWDLVYILGIDWPWYHTMGAFYWQQSICMTFIALSGFCTALTMNKKGNTGRGGRFKRGLIVFGAGALVSAVTLVFLPEDRVIFGVLTFIGSAMLITALLQNLLVKISPAAGLALSGVLFYMLRDINENTIRLLPGVTYTLPGYLFRGWGMTYLGLTDPSFWSTDYFSILPWIFWFFCGMYLCLLIGRDRLKRFPVMQFNIPPLSAMGRKSLLIYLLHQPVLYMLCMLWQMYIQK